MRTFVNVTQISLDGVMERMEDWHFDYVADPDMDDFVWETLRPCDTLVLGRRTYEGFAEAWPDRDGRIADQLNSMKKYVVSTTLTEPEWENSTIIANGVAEHLARIKDETGGNSPMASDQWYAS